MVGRVQGSSVPRHRTAGSSQKHRRTLKLHRTWQRRRAAAAAEPQRTAKGSSGSFGSAPALLLEAPEATSDRWGRCAERASARPRCGAAAGRTHPAAVGAILCCISRVVKGAPRSSRDIIRLGRASFSHTLAAQKTIGDQ